MSEGDRLVLGPAMRADLIIDMDGKPGQTYGVIDDFYRIWPTSSSILPTALQREPEFTHPTHRRGYLPTLCPSLTLTPPSGTRSYYRAT